MAAVAPRARHVGFDLSEHAIARGRALVAAAGVWVAAFVLAAA